MTFDLGKRQCDGIWGNLNGCKYFGADPDGAYCGHPKSLEISMGFGKSPNAMHRLGLCSPPDLVLWERGDE